MTKILAHRQPPCQRGGPCATASQKQWQCRQPSLPKNGQKLINGPFDPPGLRRPGVGLIELEEPIQLARVRRVGQGGPPTRGRGTKTHAIIDIDVLFLKK